MFYVIKGYSNLRKARKAVTAYKEEAHRRLKLSTQEDERLELIDLLAKLEELLFKINVFESDLWLKPKTAKEFNANFEKLLTVYV